MIYYPISTLMLAGVREILIICTPQDQKAFENLLGDGSNLGLEFTFAVQPKPEGLAQALIIGENFLSGSSTLMILGDNIFHGGGLGQELIKNISRTGAHVFTYEVANPSEYGILEVDEDMKPVSVSEKPEFTKSNLAITGLYFFDQLAPSIAKNIKPSSRGELEITSLIDSYLRDEELTVTKLTRGVTWLDAGTFDDLIEAGSYVRLLEERSGFKVACLEEIAIRNLWITHKQLDSLLESIPNLDHKAYLERVINELES
jgi:glucose-1-phosphate thymidylyltransferase